MKSALDAIVLATRSTSFEGDLFLVGGAVRDELLGRQQGSDLDLVTRQSSAELAQLLWDRGVSSIPPVTYERFGTAMVRVAGVNVEIVTARRESYSEESRKPAVEAATFLEDAERRDFTINTLQRDIFSGELIDRLGVGLADLRSKVIRTTLDPAKTFFDDPLRMLRAVRFRWQLGFEPATGLYAAIRQEAKRLEIISAERIRDEWLKMLALPTASACMQDLMDLGLLEHFAPEFVAMVGCEQGKYHHKDVWDHTLLVLDHLPNASSILKLAALFHDIGKASTRTVDEHGDTRFFRHEVVGEAMTREVMKRLKFGTSDIDAVAKLVKNHMRLGTAQVFSASAARRIVRDLGEQLPDLLELVEADASSLRPGVRVIDVHAIRDQIESVAMEQPKSGFECPISGARIMQLCNLASGPEVGRIKAAITEAILDGKFSADDIAAAEAFAMNGNN